MDWWIGKEKRENQSIISLLAHPDDDPREVIIIQINPVRKGWKSASALKVFLFLDSLAEAFLCHSTSWGLTDRSSFPFFLIDPSMMLNAWTVDRRPFLKNIGPLSLKHYMNKFGSCQESIKRLLKKIAAEGLTPGSWIIHWLIVWLPVKEEKEMTARQRMNASTFCGFKRRSVKRWEDRPLDRLLSHSSWRNGRKINAVKRIRR